MTEGWHLDKKVPIALIIVLVIQTVGVVIWGTRLDSRVEFVERSQVVIDRDRMIARSRDTALEIQVGRIRERQEFIVDEVQDISEKIDRIIEGIN